MEFRAVARSVLHRFPLPLADGLRALRYRGTTKLVPWQFMVGATPVEILEEQRWVQLVRHDNGTGQTTGLDCSGRYEGPFADAFSQHLDPNGVFLDVGAASGTYSVVAYQLGCRQIYAFEPSPARFALRRNNRRYCHGQIHIDPRFVGARTADDQVALDDFCPDRGIVPSLIKMDIEGAEVHAIDGMQQLLAESRPVLLMEFHLRKIRRDWGADPMQVPERLKAAGYRILYNGHHNYLVTHQGECDPDWHNELPNEVNCALLAIPNERP